MTLAHFVYIPGILLVGIVIGWVLGARAADLARRDAGERDEAARARVQAKAARERARGGGSAPLPSAQPPQDAARDPGSSPAAPND
jgi:hypothetical protein